MCFIKDSQRASSMEQPGVFTCCPVPDNRRALEAELPGLVGDPLIQQWIEGITRRAAIPEDFRDQWMVEGALLPGEGVVCGQQRVVQSFTEAQGLGLQRGRQAHCS